MALIVKAVGIKEKQWNYIETEKKKGHFNFSRFVQHALDEEMKLSEVSWKK